MHRIPDIAGVMVLIALIGVVVFWQLSRSRAQLREWAMLNELEILKSEFRFLRRGPFFWTSSKGQWVFYVTVRDRQSTVHSGWVRCGGWWLGLWSNKTEAKWDS